MPDLLGNPTVAELAELIAAKDETIRATDAANARTPSPWAGLKDGGAAERAWASEWAALKARYNEARALLVHAPSSLALPPEVIWGRVMHAIRQAWDPAGSLTQSAPESPGDLQDLVRRLSAQGAAPDFSTVPQPVASDPALKLFQAADVITRGLPSFEMGLLLVALFLLSRRS